MALEFFGKDPNTDGDECPTVWVDRKNADLVFQGWKTDEETERECLESGHIPETEAVIRYSRQDGSAAQEGMRCRSRTRRASRR
ncbi:hypothetical protein ACSNOK_12110 [Streptomyces sp. URMC 126]|uniref:hypothetical protein n=1 Tax=Streptomyces sp. URMC 126 TaxID=3423401 RepID=UPI003F1DB126